jgi:hypothetical protein
VAEAYQLPRTYTTVDELLADERIQGIVCVQYWPNNFAVLEHILQAGKSVITEKPQVGLVDGAEELAALAKARGLQYAVGFMKRYDTEVELAKRPADDLRRAGELGPQRAFDAVCPGDDWRQNEGGHITVDDPMPVPPNRLQAAAVTLLRAQDGQFAVTNYHAPIVWAFYRQAEGYVQVLAGTASLRAGGGLRRGCARDVPDDRNR